MERVIIKWEAKHVVVKIFPKILLFVLMEPIFSMQIHNNSFFLKEAIVIFLKKKTKYIKKLYFIIFC